MTFKNLLFSLSPAISNPIKIDFTLLVKNNFNEARSVTMQRSTQRNDENFTNAEFSLLLTITSIFPKSTDVQVIDKKRQNKREKTRITEPMIGRDDEPT